VIRRSFAERVTLAMMLAGVLLVLSSGVASAAAPRASFNDIEDEVMCVTCNVPLNIAESAQANDERDEIKRLIAMGLTKQQVLDRLVNEFGDQVLADPPTDGFNATTWLIPAGAVGGVGLFLLLLLPRWRRRTRASAAAGGVVAAAGPSLSASDLRRLDDDLAATDR
jgi:cytochrome c-type biogenesis protein CcmH